MRQYLRALAVLPLLSGAAYAAEPAQPEARSETQCELTCAYKQGSGPKLIVSCIEHTDARQCAAIADHKNLNDAYPASMSCAATLVQSCKEERRF